VIQVTVKQITQVTVKQITAKYRTAPVSRQGTGVVCSRRKRLCRKET